MIRLTIQKGPEPVFEDLCTHHFKSLVFHDGFFFRISFTYPVSIDPSPLKAKCRDCGR
jgi:hypothetical protein